MSIIKPVAQWGFSYLFFRGDVAMNPPLHVLLFGAIGDMDTMPVLGRWFSAACALSAVGVAAWVAYRVTGERVAAGVAAAVVALNPFVALEGASFRVYAWFVVTLLLRFAFMEAILRGHPARRSAWGAYVGLTALLPWIHYGAAPILFFEALGLALAGPGPRRLLAGHVVAGVLAIPLLGLILSNRERVAPGVMGFDVVDMLGGGLPSLGMPFVFVMIGHASAWKWISPMKRALVAHAAALIATFLLLRFRVQVRPPATLWALPATALMLACGAGPVAAWARGATRSQRAVGAVVGLWLGVRLGMEVIAGDYHHGFLPSLLPPDPSDAVRAWARERGEVFARAGDPAVVGMVPGWDIHNVDYYLRAHGRTERPRGCDNCVARGHLALEYCDSPSACRAHRIALFDCERVPAPPSPQCEEVWKNACGVEWLCP